MPTSCSLHGYCPCISTSPGGAMTRDSTPSNAVLRSSRKRKPCTRCTKSLSLVRFPDIYYLSISLHLQTLDSVAFEVVQGSRSHTKVGFGRGQFKRPGLCGPPASQTEPAHRLSCPCASRCSAIYSQLPRQGHTVPCHGTEHTKASSTPTTRSRSEFTKYTLIGLEHHQDTGTVSQGLQYCFLPARSYSDILNCN